MPDDAFEKLVYAVDLPEGADTGDRDKVREEFRPLVHGLLNEVAGEIAAAWGPTGVKAEGLAFALGYLRTRYAGQEGWS